MKRSTFFAALAFAIAMVPLVPSPVGTGNLAYADPTPCDGTFSTATGEASFPGIFAYDGNNYDATVTLDPATGRFVVRSVFFNPNPPGACNNAVFDPNNFLQGVVWVDGATPYYAGLQFNGQTFNLMQARQLPPKFPRLLVSPRKVVIDHVVGRSPCPTPITTLSASNVGDNGTTITSLYFYTVTGTKWLDINGQSLEVYYYKSTDLVPGGVPATFALNFNCNIPRDGYGNPVTGPYSAWIYAINSDASLYSATAVTVNVRNP